MTPGPMTPLLICASRPVYLPIVLKWLHRQDVHKHYRIFAWDNGGSSEVFREAGIECRDARDERSGETLDIGRAEALRRLVDVVDQQMPRADCYVCMGDDVLVSRDQLDVLVEVARRPGMGMIGAKFHRFNDPTPPGGVEQGLEDCTRCNATGMRGSMACPSCDGTGRNPNGLRWKVHPREDRSERRLGRVSGSLFAVSKAALRKTPWAPQLYPMVRGGTQDGSEDVALDIALTEAGLLGGHLAGAHVPAFRLPDLDPA